MNDLVKLVIMLEVQTKMLKVLLNKCIQNLKEQEDIYGRTLNWFYNTFYFLEVHISFSLFLSFSLPMDTPNHLHIGHLNIREYILKCLHRDKKKQHINYIWDYISDNYNLNHSKSVFSNSTEQFLQPSTMPCTKQVLNDV